MIAYLLWCVECSASITRASASNRNFHFIFSGWMPVLRTQWIHHVWSRGWKQDSVCIERRFGLMNHGYRSLDAAAKASSDKILTFKGTNILPERPCQASQLQRCMLKATAPDKMTCLISNTSCLGIFYSVLLREIAFNALWWIVIDRKLCSHMHHHAPTSDDQCDAPKKGNFSDKVRTDTK
jgi:hypothetical protein